MAKTPIQLYQEVNAHDAGDGDARMEGAILKSSSLAATRLAMELESIQDIIGPASTVDSEDVYDAIDAIDVQDGDHRIKQMLFQKMGLAFSRLAMAAEGIKDKLSEGWHVKTLTSTVTMAPSPAKKVSHQLSASISATSSITTV